MSETGGKVRRKLAEENRLSSSTVPVFACGGRRVTKNYDKLRTLKLGSDKMQPVAKVQANGGLSGKVTHISV